MAKQENCPTTILRRPLVEARTGMSKSSIYLAIQKGQFPRPIKLGARAVGWLERDIDIWISQRIEASKQKSVGQL